MSARIREIAQDREINRGRNLITIKESRQMCMTEGIKKGTTKSKTKESSKIFPGNLSVAFYLPAFLIFRFEGNDEIRVFRKEDEPSTKGLT